MQFPRYASTPSSANLMRKPSIAEDKNYVGIDQLKDQTKLKVLRKGFVFNLMVVGRSGLGKSTLVDTLFKASVSQRNNYEENKENEMASTMKIISKTTILNENGVKLSLTVTDTPGFGDQINNEDCWLPIINFIEGKYSEYLLEEQKIDRPAVIPDGRVHCCLYFIQPGGHSLTSLDIEVLKKLSKVVNVIPVIAKSDSLTLEERTSFKESVKADLLDHGIVCFPNKEMEEEEDKEENDKIRDIIPFAVVGSTNYHEAPINRKVLGRKTKWGIIEVENKQHCEFTALRDLIIRSHMADLVELTSSYFFEKFRKKEISKVGGSTEEDKKHNNIKNKSKEHKEQKPK